MPVKLGEIDGVMVKKLPIQPLLEWGKTEDNLTARYCAEHGNAVIDQQSQVKIGLNREKLAKIIYENTMNYDGEQFETWNEVDEDFRKLFYSYADFIIAAEHDLLEVKK